MNEELTLVAISHRRIDEVVFDKGSSVHVRGGIAIAHGVVASRFKLTEYGGIWFETDVPVLLNTDRVNYVLVKDLRSYVAAPFRTEDPASDWPLASHQLGLRTAIHRQQHGDIRCTCGVTKMKLELDKDKETVEVVFKVAPLG